MSLFEQASLVITPNAQKEGKLYSIKPTDGSGDLDVVRATSATRVNEQGLIEIPRTNLLLRSEEFDDAYWTKQNTTTTSNQSIAPDGTNTADLLYPNSTGTFRAVRRNVTVSGIQTYTFSFFAKASGFQWLRIRSIEGNPIYANFDVLNGIVGVVETGLTASITPFNNGWFRCVVVGNSSSTIASCYINLSDDNGTGAPNATANGTNGVFLWGAQLEVGNVATEYIPTTSVIRTRFAGITQDGGSANNIPRLDYTNASCPSILVEPQRTNLLLRSEEFDNASWVKTNATITANSVIAPDGTLTADTINVSVQDVERVIQRVLVGTSISGITYTGSIWIKGQGSNIGKLVRFRIKRNSGGSLSDVVVNYTLTSNWVRISATFTGLTDNTGIAFGFDGATNYADSFDVWGAQLEAGSTATSYIPTVASTVTRNADVISKTGVSSLIGQTEGTIYAEVNFRTLVAGTIFTIDSGTTANYITIIKQANHSIRVEIKKTSTAAAILFTTSTLSTGIHKIALSYQNGNYNLFVDGLLLGTSTNSTDFPTATLSRIVLSSTSYGVFDDSYNSVVLFPTLLDNATLQQLTTL